MLSTINLFKQLQETSGKNDKISIIQENASNSIFTESLVFLLDGNVTTGIAAKKYDKLNVKSSNWIITEENLNSEYINLLEYIKEHNTGRDEDILMAKSFCCNMSEEVQEFIRGMVTKTIKLGCDAKSVNKAIPDLIRTFDVMLGTPIDKVKIKPNETIFLSRKLNGSRAAFVGDKLMTRQGKQYLGCDHIIKDLQDLGLSNMFVDGELLYKNPEGLSDSEAFQKGVGIAMSKETSKPELKLVVFDAFPLDQFWSGKSEETYSQRFERVNSYRELFANTDNLEVVEHFYHGNDHEEIWKWLNYAEEHDYEGIMINLDSPYVCKRTKDLIKVKKFFSMDILCTELEEGSGKNKGTLGAIVCDYKGYELKVGSGFTDEQRNYYWNNPDEIVGRVVEVKYKEETKNKDGGLSVQFPVFIVCREEGKEVSFN